MASQQTVQEVEESLGQVPGWMEIIAEPASDHWGIFRDLNLGETELSPREKALIGVSAAAAMNCPYCTYFHKEEARFAGVSEAELKEAVNVAGITEYFSTLLHGNEYEEAEFATETDEIFEHIRDQQAAQADD
ncbi:carboxymuconolactone decarboxylase family protein [Halosimplex aquaticum]|uniref:Carboxymuconolactone decarboxylase family protein n=1 Tax=Halosimplex aquaticum TaxID=3026162 RepID=A0ABD5XT14_9EURY|nr:carboxymuconolactone decarboxylase family protein [Halosimplex aquaticum]